MSKIIHKEALKLSKQCYGDVKTNMTQQQVWDIEAKIVKIQTYIHEQEKRDELLALKNCEIKLLNKKHHYLLIENNDKYIECKQEILEVRKQIKALESELNA